MFEFWALPHQLPPEGDWRTWVILGGRGAGKTRAGAEWVRAQAEGPTPDAPGLASHIAIVGETFDQARDVMVFGESGILAVSPESHRPEWMASRRMLTWPNGATAQVYSAHDPNSLRGPQFDALWADELAKWKNAEDAWDMLQFTLRLGDHPRAVVTTTPRNNDTLRAILQRDSTVSTHAKTSDNRANLAESFLSEIEEQYAGTRLGQQELDGVMLNDVEGALWTPELLLGARRLKEPPMSRIVVAVDPATSHHKKSDACGIIVAGAFTEGPLENWRVTVLEDATVQGATPMEWAKRAVDAFHRHGADRLIAETNQGGAMVEATIRQIDQVIPYTAVHAKQGKALRAEPVAALYEQGRVHHARGLAALEDEMCAMTLNGYEGSGSPDRVDALVWAVHHLVIGPSLQHRSPRCRTL